MGAYRVGYADEKTRAGIEKFLEKTPRNFRSQILDDIKGLGENPRPAQSLRLLGNVFVRGHRAHFRLRSGDYRIFYGVDELNKTVLIIGLRRRNERTYK